MVGTKLEIRCPCGKLLNVSVQRRRGVVSVDVARIVPRLFAKYVRHLPRCRLGARDGASMNGVLFHMEEGGNFSFCFGIPDPTWSLCRRTLNIVAETANHLGGDELILAVLGRKAA